MNSEQHPHSQMRMIPTMVIITQNTLMSIGLVAMLERLAPMANILPLSSVEALESVNVDEVFHFFVSVQVAVENINFFRTVSHKTILLTMGEGHSMGEFKSVNIAQSESGIVADIRALHTSAHGDAVRRELLTPREIEVLRCVVQGHINKEIASLLNISVTTVISHRKNIVEKLGARSVSALTIYAIMQGYIEL